MLDILGLLVEAAAVNSHRRDSTLNWRCEIASDDVVSEGFRELLIYRAQHRIVGAEERDMISLRGWAGFGGELD